MKYIWSHGTLTNEQLGLPPQQQLVRIAEAVRNGVQASQVDEEEEEE